MGLSSRRPPIAVKSSLRKAPAIVVNRGDEVLIGGRRYGVADYGEREGTIVVYHLAESGGYRYMAFHVDRIEAWKKG